MSRKTDLAMVRDRQLATLRKATGKPLQFILALACAKQDRDYLATFTRFSPDQPFRCERVELQSPSGRSILGRLKALLRGRQPVSISLDDIALEDVTCPGCAAQHVWTRCGACGSYVCASSRSGEMFQCRPRCGLRGRTMLTFTAVGAKGGGTSSPLALGRTRGKALTWKG